MTNTQTPAQIDTELAGFYADLAKLNRDREWTLDQIHRAAGDKKSYQWGESIWAMTDDKALVTVVKALEEGTTVAYLVERHQELIEDLRANRNSIKAVKAEIDARDAEFAARGGWSRFFIVNNSNGHIHSSMHCSSCNNGQYNTDFGWNPQLSGKSEADAVAELGEILCTICFPSAPVAWTNGTSRKDQVAKAERAAAKAARAAKAAATGISNPDGSPLRGKWGIVKAERTAQSELVDLLADQQTGYDHDLHLIPSYTAALAHKRSQTVEEVLASLAPKVAVKVKAIMKWKTS